MEKTNMNYPSFNKIKNLYPLLVVSFIILPFYSWSLSATTAATIKGRAPQLLAAGGPASNPSDAISITVPNIGSTFDTYYGNSTLPSTGFPSTLTFNNFVPSFNNTIYDEDGDGAASTPISHSGFVVNWKDKYGQPVLNLGDSLSSCHSPYQLIMLMYKLNMVIQLLTR